VLAGRVGVGVLAALVSPLYLVWPMGFWAVLGGYWSHIQIDMTSIQGVDVHQILKDFDIAYSEFVKVQGLNWHTLELKAKVWGCFLKLRINCLGFEDMKTGLLNCEIILRPSSPSRRILPA